MTSDLIRFLGCVIILCVIIPLLPVVLVVLIIAALTGHPVRFGGYRNYFFQRPGNGDGAAEFGGGAPEYENPSGQGAVFNHDDFDGEVIDTEVISAKEENDERKSIDQ